jgi:hypothetical protein
MGRDLIPWIKLLKHHNVGENKDCILKKKHLMMMMMMMMIIIIIHANEQIQNIFHSEWKLHCSTNCKYRTAATLYTLETWFVSGI